MRRVCWTPGCRPWPVFPLHPPPLARFPWTGGVRSNSSAAAEEDLWRAQEALLALAVRMWG
eukprot:6237548-Prymnesium_polylepis.1